MLIYPSELGTCLSNSDVYFTHLAEYEWTTNGYWDANDFHFALGPIFTHVRGDLGTGIE